MTTVWVYVDTNHYVGRPDHLKVFATPDAADEWFKENDPEGVALGYEVLESVRKHQAGLQSFRSMRRIEARRKNARPLRLRFSQSLASRLQRLSQAIVRSTIQRLGSTAKPLT